LVCAGARQLSEFAAQRWRLAINHAMSEGIWAAGTLGRRVSGSVDTARDLLPTLFFTLAPTDRATLSRLFAADSARGIVSCKPFRILFCLFTHTVMNRKVCGKLLCMRCINGCHYAVTTVKVAFFLSFFIRQSARQCLARVKHDKRQA
jgi:hypothetical protein